MDSEIQRRRTFEIIAKWIGKKHGITIEFQPNVTPCADPKTKKILLPNNLKEENLDKVIALVLHEAGHIAHSTFDIPKLVTNQEEMSVLNTAEDIRIDNINMSYLPKIREFYEELDKWELEQQPPENEIPFEHKVCCDIIRNGTGFQDSMTKDPKVRDLIDKNNLDYRVASELRNKLEYLENYAPDYPKTKKQIEEITDIIYGKKKSNGSNRTPLTQEQIAMGLSGLDEMGQGNVGKGQAGAAGKGKLAVGLGKDGKGKPGGLGCGHEKLFEIDPNAKVALDEVSLTEQTQQAFNELLTIKSLRVIPDGVELDTNNLTAFFTGDIDGLFKEIKKYKHKKSKIIMVLDSSGSMHSSSGLCDNKTRCQIVANVAKHLQVMLDEIREVEGVNVDYDVRGFDCDYYKFDKDTWQEDYLRRNGGSTYADAAIIGAQDEIMADPLVDGNKIIILISDGDIDQHQIETIKDRLMKHSSDIKVMILGVGLSPEFEREIGGRNIMADSLADGVVLEAISDMLED